MGLFGPGPSYSRLGRGAKGAAAHDAVGTIARTLEAELRDTPGEYFVLQAAGMLFTSQSSTMRGVQAVRSMEESLVRATQIMAAFVEKSSTDAGTLRSRAVAVHDQLGRAAAAGVEPAFLVGHLNGYLQYVDNVYLTRKAPHARRWKGKSMGLGADPRELELRRQYRFVYWLHASVVWTIVSLVQYFAMCLRPVETLLSMKAEYWWPIIGWIVLVPIVLSRGILLTFMIAQTCFGGSRAATIALPLTLAGGIGFLQGALLVVIERTVPQLGLSLRNDVVSIVLALFLGLLVTPVIIVRSRSMLIRKGIRVELPPKGDPRWRF